MRYALKVESHCLRWEVECSEPVLNIECEFAIWKNVSLQPEFTPMRARSNLMYLKCWYIECDVQQKNNVLRNSLSLELNVPEVLVH